MGFFNIYNYDEVFSVANDIIFNISNQIKDRKATFFLFLVFKGYKIYLGRE